MIFPVFSLLAGNFGFRDGFARDCLLQRRVTREPEPPLVLLGAGGPRTQFRYPASKPWESGQMESMTTQRTDG